jgi:hypothetical protein
MATARIQATATATGAVDAQGSPTAPGSSSAEDGLRRLADGQSMQAAARGAQPEDEPEPLQAEEHENDPRSETVIIKVLVDPPRHSRISWGPKDLGAAPLEIRRPRGSGPLDLVVRTPGYLTVHTRAFSDRDDKVTIRLVPDSDARRMLGYRAPVAR